MVILTGYIRGTDFVTTSGSSIPMTKLKGFKIENNHQHGEEIFYSLRNDYASSYDKETGEFTYCDHVEEVVRLEDLKQISDLLSGIGIVFDGYGKDLSQDLEKLLSTRHTAVRLGDLKTIVRSLQDQPRPSHYKFVTTALNSAMEILDSISQ